MGRIDKMKKYIVQKECILKAFIEETMTDLSKHKRKSFLANGIILVNGKVRTKYDYPLKVNDVVSLKDKTVETDLNILYEDKDIIVVDKPAGILTVSTNKMEEVTLYREVSDYVKKQKISNRIFIVHRLDRDTSGVILFCKDQRLKRQFQDHWNDLVLLREYIGVVEGTPNPRKGCIKQYLMEDDHCKVYTTKNTQEGKLAITNYEVLWSTPMNALVKFNLETGRKNQIRVACESIHHPIIGDRKYGAKSSPIKRLGLHASKFVCVHPVTREKMEFESKIPKQFDKIMSK